MRFYTGGSHPDRHNQPPRPHETLSSGLTLVGLQTVLTLYGRLETRVTIDV